MTVELMHTLAVTAFVIAGILLVLAVMLFFVFKIPAVIGDLSGRTAQRAIENIRHQNEISAAGGKIYSGALTDKMSRSGRLIIHHTAPLISGARTEKIATDNLNPNATECNLPESETTILNESFGETSVLSEHTFSETVVLSPDMMTNHTEENKEEQSSCVQSNYGIEEEITYMDTDEIIE